LEQRKSERLELSLPVTISKTGIIPPMELETKNISTGGIFIETDSCLPVSTTLTLAIQVTPKGNNSTGNRTFVKLKGRVLRSNDRGIAIQFIEDQFFFRA